MHKSKALRNKYILEKNQNSEILNLRQKGTFYFWATSLAGLYKILIELGEDLLVGVLFCFALFCSTVLTTILSLLKMIWIWCLHILIMEIKVERKFNHRIKSNNLKIA